MFCTKCGTELPEGTQHCSVCGAAVRQLPPLDPGQTAPAGQTGQTPPPSGPAYVRQQGQPAYQAPPQNSGGAYQRPPAQAAPGTAYQATPQGSGLEHASGPAYQAQQPSYPSAPVYSAYHSSPAESPETVGLLDWLLSTIITFVPVVGLVLLCIWAFTDNVKASKRNWARATLILYLAVLALFFGVSFYLALTDPTIMESM